MSCTPLHFAALVAAAMTVSLHGQEAGAPSARSLRTLQVSFVSLQAADLHSTFRALDSGAAEMNPVMAQHWGAVLGLKAGASLAVVLATHKLAKKHPKAVRLTLAALDGAYAAIIVHNYRVSRR
jgi:hypothetical protein